MLRIKCPKFANGHSVGIERKKERKKNGGGVEIRPLVPSFLTSFSARVLEDCFPRVWAKNDFLPSAEIHAEKTVYFFGQ